MGKLTIRVINRSKHPLPTFATDMSAGVDLRANIDEDIVLRPLQRVLVPTGLYLSLTRPALSMPTIVERWGS